MINTKILKKGLQLLGVLVLLSMIGLTACHKTDDDQSGDLKISFSPKYGSEDFVTLKSFPYAGTRAIKWSKFDFYVTGIRLVSASGSLDVSDVGMIDFTSTDVNNRLINLRDIPAGDYTGIEFNVGVGTDLNKKQPKDYSSSNPLSSTSHYWEAWNSYIFSKMEGVFDSLGTGTFDLGFAIHTGTDECLQRVSIAKNIKISNGASSEMGLDLDIKNVYAPGGSFFDLKSSPLNHNPTNIEVLKLFSTRLAAAIQLKN